MKATSRKGDESNWISFSDIMTGLMVIFMFIAISYIAKVQEIFTEFRKTKEDISESLDNEFKAEYGAWNMVLNESDLSIIFKNPDFLFEGNKYELKDTFMHILDEFLPRYFNVLLDEQFDGKISEIRVEGHANPLPSQGYDSDPYIGNLKLSQLRASSVVKYFMASSYYQSLTAEKQNRLMFMLTANGLSFGRTVDSTFQLTHVSGNAIDHSLSKRIEFKVVTKSEELQKALND